MFYYYVNELKNQQWALANVLVCLEIFIFCERQYVVHKN